MSGAILFWPDRLPSQDDQASKGLLENAITRLGLSARVYDRILKVSRTLADVEGKDKIEPNHVSEAIQYRTLDRNFWA